MELLTRATILRALGALGERLPQGQEAHLVPGRELKAKYAFDDLWEAARGPA